MQDLSVWEGAEFASPRLMAGFGKKSPRTNIIEIIVAQLDP
jgi:hypothetical protein